MRRKTKRLLCLALVLLMLLPLAACKKDTPEQQPPAPETSAPASTTPSNTPSQTPDTPAPPPPAAEPQTVVVGYSNFSQKFSPFFAKTAYDVDVEEMTQILLLINDRAGNVILKGIEGETYPYNGKDYFYSNIADFDVVQKPDGTVDYNIKLREDIVFSDGVPMTIDDVIFSIYVYSDPAYDGSTTFYSMPVTGMKSFRTGVTADIYDKYEALGYAIFAAGPDNTDFSGWTAEQQDAFFTTYLQKGGVMFAQEIVDFCIGNYLASYGAYYSMVHNSEVGFGMFMWGFADMEEVQVGEEPVVDEDTGEPVLDEETGEPVMDPIMEETGFLVGEVTGAKWDVANGIEPTAADYWNEIFEAYGMDFSDSTGINVEVAETPIEDFMVLAFISGEGPKDPAAGGEIMNIAGLKRTGDYSMTVTTDYFEATSIYNFGFAVAPKHYYGDVSLYDYNNNMFGFTKGDLSLVKSKTTSPMGAGPYKYISYANGVVSYEANENYWKGEPKVKYMRFQECADADKLAGIVAGTFDVTDPSFNKTTVESIMGYNSNGEITGDAIYTSTVDNLGYGYIGICATTVNVAGDPPSQASRYLRTAFATLFAVYRNTVINSYYGARASVIQYPISNTSWAAPRPNDEGYRLAYSVDVDGKPIYNDSMNEAQRYAAALDAAVGYFKAAGFTWDAASGKFTAAPAGAQMTYEAIIPADGVGDHPAFGILTAAKEALATIGITLDINDPTNSNVLWRALESGQAEIWCAAWGATIDPDMYQVYHSSNIYGLGGTDSNHYAIADPELDDLIMVARSSADQSFRKATYKRCLEIIMEWAVEVPNYQRQNAVIFAPDRVNMATVTPDITTFWTWLHDLELLETNT